MRFLTVALMALLVWALPSAAARAASPDPGSATATASAVTKKRALKKALKRCRKIRKATRRKTCVRKARRRFARSPRPDEPVKPKPGRTWRVDVLDDYVNDYFSPDWLEIEAGDLITWVWSDMNQNPHNVTLLSSPPGINRSDYATPNAPSRNFTWTRQLNKPGMWTFGCSLHHFMRMAVKVNEREKS
jgi:plastocyanin